MLFLCYQNALWNTSAEGFRGWEYLVAHESARAAQQGPWYQCDGPLQGWTTAGKDLN